MPMTAVEYLREKARMTQNCGSMATCVKCPLGRHNNKENIGCGEYTCKFPEKAVEIVEQWSKAHPKKTYLDDFKEKFPNCAYSDTEIVDDLCRKKFYSNQEEYCDNRLCKDCWNKEYVEGLND